MLTPELQEIVNSVHLSDEKKEKVCLIKDINEAVLIYIGQQVTTQDFDMLYDRSLISLNAILRDLQAAIMKKLEPIL